MNNTFNFRAAVPIVIHIQKKKIKNPLAIVILERCDYAFASCLAHAPDYYSHGIPGISGMYDKPPARDAPNVLTHVQNDAESDSRANHAMLSLFGAVALVVLAACYLGV